MAQVTARRTEIARRLLPLAVVLLLGFALRIYRIDAVPLRGDEAFAVEHWAAPPLDAVRDLAETEPHPIGTFFAFWGWKQIAGDGVLAMRYFPLLGNLLGVAAVAALGRQFFRSERIAVLAALLWAVNPFQIWHAQDVRNYALWAGLSPVAMWLFIRAANSERSRDWAQYVLAALLALNAFFLEAFLLPVQAAYLLVRRRGFGKAILAWIPLGILLIPWLIQAWLLSNSGYTGTLKRGDAGELITWFLPTLLFGDSPVSPWDSLLPLAWIALVALAIVTAPRRARANLWWLILWIALPTTLLYWRARSMSVFHPRYLITISPALLLLTAWAIDCAWQAVRSPANLARRGLALAPLALAITPLLGLSPLFSYYRAEQPKAPDWPAVAAFLSERTAPQQLIVQPAADPAFVYYYDGPAAETSLVPDVDARAQLISEVYYYDAIWLINPAPAAEDFLGNRMQAINRHQVGEFTVALFRQQAISPDEIATPADVVFGDVARLAGSTLIGPGSSDPATTVLLYWEPLRQTEVDYKVFVHLVGAPDPATGSPLWDQDDHRPREGFASTLTWETGSLVRDPYHLLDEGTFPPPGDYALLVGLYDPNTNERLPVRDTAGDVIGDNWQVGTLTLR